MAFRSRLDEWFQSCREGVILLRVDGKILWRNASAAELLSTTGEDPAGGDFCRMLVELLKAQTPDSLRKAADGRLSPDQEGEEVRSDGIRMQEKALQAAHLASLGELAAGVAHEINNPVTGIINCGQILYDHLAAGSSDQEIAQRIIREGERISAIVRSLLFLAHSGQDRKERVRIEEELADVLSLTRAQMRKERIIAIVRVVPELPAITASAQRIRQVFLNIINNARYALNEKFPGFSEEKILEIRGERIAGPKPGVRLTFLDYGTGIPESLQDRIFDPFFTTKPAGRGTGLGLSISHSIIADLCGKLGVESVEGEFTRVTVELPAAEGGS